MHTDLCTENFSPAEMIVDMCVWSLDTWVAILAIYMTRHVKGRGRR